MIRRFAIGCAALVAVSSSSAAQAQEVHVTNPPLAAPFKALELTAATGYTQGFGALKSGVGLSDVVRTGMGFDIGVAWRISPELGIGLSAQYQQLRAHRAEGTRGLTTGIDATLHFIPSKRLDPYLRFGVGYRVLWESNFGATPTGTYPGFQLAKVMAGVDLRTRPRISLGPMIGADLDMFFQTKGGNSGTGSGTPFFSTFVFAGVQGRFDVGGTTSLPRTAPSVAHY